MTKDRKNNSIQNVDEYIANCPEKAQDGLKTMRATIQEVVPDARERTDYFQMPGYSYEDEEYDYNGMFVWFSFKEPHVRLHVRPPVIDDHKEELAEYKTTKAIVSFPMDKKIPKTIVKKLVKASLRVMKGKAGI